jgi:peptide/nickel transport system permease protein
MIEAALRVIRSNAAGRFGLFAVALIVGAALLAPWLGTHAPNAIDPINRLAPPSADHWLGTDQLGRDLFTRLLYGARTAIAVALAVIALALSVGVLLGMTAAYLPPHGERLILILFDIISSFPSVILALALVAVLGPGFGNVILLIAVVFVPHFGRIARAQTLTLKNSPFLEAEIVLGASPWRRMRHHVLPNIIGPIVVLASMDIPVVITIEAGLSFLGLGVRPPIASWGSMLNDGYNYLDQSYWPVIASGVALTLATLGFTLLGEAFRDAIDPKLRRQP